MFCSNVGGTGADPFLVRSQDAINKIKERKKLKEQLSDRKSLAAQNRMKSIANLASEGKAGKKRKRGDKGELLASISVLRSCMSDSLLPLGRGRFRQERR